MKILNTITPRPGMLITFLDGEGIQLELIQNEKNPKPLYGKDISFAFDVGNLNDFLLKVKNYGIQEIEGPVKMGVNHIFAFITDPNGLKIQLSGF